MRIETETDHLMVAIDNIARTAPPPSGNITLTTKDNKLKITSVSDLSRCVCIVPAKVEGDGEVALPMLAFRDAIKGRKEVKIEIANATLQIRAGAYKAQLATVDAIPTDDMAEEVQSKWKVDNDQRDWLKKVMKDVALKPTAILSAWIPLGVYLTPKGSFVACYDEQHMSWVSTKEITGDLNCVLPLDTFQSLVEVFKTGFVLHKNKASITVKDKLTSVTLSIPSTDDVPDLETVRAKVQEAKKMKAETLKCSKKSIEDFLSNARSVVTKERAELMLTADQGKAELVINTVNGKVQTKIKCAGDVSFKVDLEYFQEVLGKAPEEVVINVVADSFISVELLNSSALVALNQS